MMKRLCCLVAVCLALTVLRAEGEDAVPVDDPTEDYGLDWTSELPWNEVISVNDAEGETLEERLAAAQEAVTKRGGGVVYFPAGVYQFRDYVRIRSGVILRGANCFGGAAAGSAEGRCSTTFEFPQYVPSFEGEGTSIETAFKGIVLANPATASDCGIVDLEIDHAHVDFGEAEDHRCGGKRIVFRCTLRNAAVADVRIPRKEFGQHGWQRFTGRHHAAISVKGENVLVARNRLPKSGDDDFVMNGYVLRGRNGLMSELDGVVFDYDNRPGIYVNNASLGGAGGSLPDGTPETHPWGFRKGVVIRDNQIYCTGRCAIAFTGDGTVCAENVIRFAKDVWRPTATGDTITSGSSTNDNRAVQMRGWRWIVSGNEYEVHRNWAADRKYLINDGEGLMHEDHANSIVRESKLINNRGNSYISIYKTGGIDGLVIEGNEIRTSGGIAAIYVVANRNNSNHECRNVRIAGNVTAGSGIEIAGSPAEANVVENNRHIGDGGKLVDRADAQLRDNEGYEIVR